MIATRPLRLCLAAALLLPLAVLAYSWAATHHLAGQGQDWLVPIQGYDPRDLLRGHYVQYRYDWPVPASSSPDRNGRVAPFDPSSADRLCIEGQAPIIVRVRDLPPQADASAVKGCAVVARATLGTRREVRGLDSGILFLSQPRALALSRQLAERSQQGFIRVRIRPDGVMRPIDMEFRPR